MHLLVKIKQLCLLSFFILLTHSGFSQQGLLITEIMAKPANEGNLPAEYVEIYNNSNRTVSLRNIQLRVATTSIPLLDYFLAPRQYIVLTAAENTHLFEPYGNVMGLTSWRILNNQGAAIALIDHTGHIVDQVTYADNWYGGAEKKAGNWSLERINPGISCNNQLTWTASLASRGGTPGQQNSVWNEDFVPELDFRILDVQADRIRLQINGSSEALHIQAPNQFVLQPGSVSAVDYSITNDTITIHLNAELTPDLPYKLQLSDIAYCARQYDKSIPLIFASANKYNDIVVNEVLFNPKAESVDFVEIYNRSTKTINLRHWRLGDRIITDQLHLFAPGEYRVLSTSTQSVYQSYPRAATHNFIEMPSLPAYANNGGHVILRDHERQTIDSIVYTSSQHQPFLADVKGISLERQSTEVDGNVTGNFVSASTLSGGATPGYANSNQAEIKSAKNLLQLQSKTFSPDQDGFEDLLLFTYAFEESNLMLSLTLFDDKGRAVNRLIRNKSAGYAGELTWDGIDENGKNCPAGIYIYLAEIVSSTGHYQTFKGSFVLAGASKKY